MENKIKIELIKYNKHHPSNNTIEISKNGKVLFTANAKKAWGGTLKNNKKLYQEFGTPDYIERLYERLNRLGLKTLKYLLLGPRRNNTMDQFKEIMFSVLFIVCLLCLGLILFSAVVSSRFVGYILSLFRSKDKNDI